MKKFILTLVAVLTIFASTAEARGPHAYNRGRHHYSTPRRQVVVVNNHHRRPSYNHGYYGGGYYYRSGRYDRDTARVGAVVLGVGALALAVSSF